YARKRVIEDAKAAGIRYRELSAAEITRSAVDYLDGPHGPELIAKATQTLAEWAARDRQRRDMRRRRRAKVSSEAQKPIGRLWRWQSKRYGVPHCQTTVARNWSTGRQAHGA